MKLKEFINEYYASIDECAAELSVSRRTIENYIYVNPCGILKHSGRIVTRKNVDPLQLFDAVGESMKEINQKQIKQ
jgi:predicted DNA-binding protein YlxM (UPF0122 family)